MFELVGKAQAYILNNTRRRFVINENGPCTEIPKLPTQAVKEALMNAYAHYIGRSEDACGSVYSTTPWKY